MLTKPVSLLLADPTEIAALSFKFRYHREQ